MHSKDELIISNMPLVKHIAAKYHTSKMGIEYEDLVSYGVMGLIDAGNKFDSNRGVKFSTYASMKIKSFIIDEIRKQSPTSRLAISKIKEFNNSIETLQKELLREPTIGEIAFYMGISMKEVSDIRLKALNLNTTSLDTLMFEDDGEIRLIDTIKDNNVKPPSDIIVDEEKVEVMAKALDMLKEKDRLVLSLYYYEELTLKEIGVVLGVSESRVSQLNSKAIANLRNAMKKLNYIE